jgi:hypothetical protein
MRRVRERRPSTLFRGGEMPRLLTMIVMLGVLVLLFDRARDQNTWRWLAPDAPNPPATAPEAPESDTGADDAADGPAVAGSGLTDEDPQQLDAAREEFQAVTDKAPLAKEEMPAYWRLMEWQQTQSIKQLQKRATAGVTFREFWNEPQKWRGKLVQVSVHLRQTAKVDDAADNALGLKTIYEVWGWNSDSQPYCYWLVCPQLPPGMPSGSRIQEEGTFVGYFLKLLPYEDHLGKTSAIPLLIGQLVWHPMPNNSLVRSDDWTWEWLLAGGLAALFVARWVLAFADRRRARATPGRLHPDDGPSVEAWLDGAEDSEGHHDSSFDDNGHRSA